MLKSRLWLEHRNCVYYWLFREVLHQLWDNYQGKWITGNRTHISEQVDGSGMCYTFSSVSRCWGYFYLWQITVSTADLSSIDDYHTHGLGTTKFVWKILYRVRDGREYKSWEKNKKEGNNGGFKETKIVEYKRSEENSA